MESHAANTYNKYAVTPDGSTPYAALHGKNSKEKLAEFGERVLWHVPKKLRAKLDLCWRLCIYVGYAVSSNEYYRALPMAMLSSLAPLLELYRPGDGTRSH